jgi:hypothetical protein
MGGLQLIFCRHNKFIGSQYHRVSRVSNITTLLQYSLLSYSTIFETMKRNYRITILLILGLSHGFLDVFSFQPIPIPICNNISRIKPCHKFHATPQSKSSNDRLRFLTPDQEEFLNSLDEHTYGNQFIERLRDLQAYKNEHGTCHVPKRYAQNPTLGKPC